MKSQVSNSMYLLFLGEAPALNPQGTGVEMPKVRFLADVLFACCSCQKTLDGISAKSLPRAAAATSSVAKAGANAGLL